MKDKFELYLKLLLEANAVMNLTAIREPEEIRVRHFEDSLFLLNTVNFIDKNVLDVGSGAGLPGLVLKIAQPELSLTLLEATGKKAGFLKSTSERLCLSNVRVVNARAEEYARTKARESFDIVTARGVAALNVLAELCLPFVKVGGYFLAMKETVDETAEVEKLGGAFEPPYTYTLSNGIQHSVIIIKKIAPCPEIYPRAWAQIKNKPL